MNVRRLSLLAAWCAALLWPAAASAQGNPREAASGALQRLATGAALRVCIWPNYYGISLRHPRTQELQGLDIDMARALAQDLNAPLTFVDSSFPTLIDDLLQDRCDIAMFGVGVLPARAAKLRFTEPYLQSDIYAVTTRANRVVRQWSDIDQPGVKVAVQAGTLMEPVMRQTLRQAQMVVVTPPATREQELESGRVDVFMTDYPYSRRLLDNADWARLIASPTPFHVMPYAYPVKPGDEAWFQRVSAFVAAIKRDGRLRNAAQRHGLGTIAVTP